MANTTTPIAPNGFTAIHTSSLRWLALHSDKALAYRTRRKNGETLTAAEDEDDMITKAGIIGIVQGIVESARERGVL